MTINKNENQPNINIKTVELTDNELNDIASCIEFTLRKYPDEGAKYFKRDLDKIKRKVWIKIREKYKEQKP